MLLGMHGAVWAGAALGRRNAISGEHERGVSLVVGTLFTLLGLLLAFTLSASAGRLDNRRTAAIQEANAIGTACLRLDILPDDERIEARKLFKEYIDERLRFNQRLSGVSVADGAGESLGEIQGAIWSTLARATPPDSRLLMLNPTNEAFDLAATREVLSKTYTPRPMFWFLIFLSVLCSFLVGEATASMGRRGWPYRIVFCLAITASLFIVADLDNPRIGLIKIDYVDGLLRQTRDSL